tara:strand:- start:4160 stop:4846 length:687 start_codon:yes stop_codon:yes gene_type:complete
LARRLSPNQINEIKESFIKGSTIDFLSKKYNCARLTITRNLKKILGDKIYKKVIEEFDINKSKKTNNKKVRVSLKGKQKKDKDINKDSLSLIENNYDNTINGEIFKDESFVELAPLHYEINAESQKDISSIPISSIDFPKTVYMIVDKKIELEIKYLKDYPEWQFLPKEDLERKTIEIFYDIKIAKRACNKEQKVMKVPNTNVFRIVAPILISRGISRIVNDEQLISL